MTDHDIFYFVIPRVNLERQALYGLFAFLLLLPAVFGPQDRSLIRRIPRSWPMASLGVISYGHLSVASGSHQRGGPVDGLGCRAHLLLDAGRPGTGRDRPHRLGQLLRARAAPPPVEGPDQLVDGPARHVGKPSGPDVSPVVHVSRTGEPSAAEVDSAPQPADDRPEVVGRAGGPEPAPGALRRASSPMSTSTSPHSADRVASEESETDGGALVDDVLERAVPGRILDLHAEVAVPEVVRLPGPGRWSGPPVRRVCVRAAMSASRARRSSAGHVFDHTHRVDPVERRIEGKRGRAVQFHERWARPAAP